MALHAEDKRVLITGVSGFTGPYVREQLIKLGYEVHGLVIDNPKSGQEHRASLLDQRKIIDVLETVQPSSVIHLAGISSVTYSDVGEVYEANILGTRNLLAALTSTGFGHKSVILASSANVYGNSSSSIVDEGTTPSPENDYAVSKLAMENMSRLWSDRLPIVLTRPFNYTGVGQSPKFVIPKIVQHFQKREATIELGNLDVHRDFSDVRTVAWAYAELCKNPMPGETFNISSGVGISISQVISLLQELTGHEIRVQVNADFVREHEVKTLIGDSSKLWNHLGCPLDLTFKETLRWMLQN